MKNWKYINGAEIGNAKWSILEVTNPNTPNDGKYVGTIEADTKYEAESKFKKENPNIENRVVAVKVNNASVEEQNDKFFKSLKKDVEEKEEGNDEKIEKVGNSKAGEKNVWKEGPYHIEQLTEDGNFGWYKMPKGSFVAYRNDVVYGNFKTLDEAKRKLQDEINKDKEYNRKYTTNSKTGNEKISYSPDKLKSASWTTWKYIISHPEKYDEKTVEEAKKLDKVGNSKTGNSTYDMTERDYENEYKSLVQKRNNLQTGTKEYEDIQKRLEEIRKKIGRSPFGNSASDDKFAYVMREFDEGKLKTPDGKVVTSPEQAKAIAYSESKKAENGLARARNAMACNKKVGNWNSERTIDPVGKYPAFLKNLKNAIDLGVAAVNYDSVDEATLKAWVEQAKKEGYGAHIGGVQGHKVTLK